MVRNATSKSKVQLNGIFCLPTSSKYHCSEPERSGAYVGGQTAYVLTATQSLEDGGYPPQVVLTAADGELSFGIGDEPDTQHAQQRKNLPPRRVTGIVMPDGTTHGEVPGTNVGLPHWEFVPSNVDGTPNLDVIAAVAERIRKNRTMRELARKASRETKKGTKEAA